MPAADPRYATAIALEDVRSERATHSTRSEHERELVTDPSDCVTWALPYLVQPAGRDDLVKAAAVLVAAIEHTHDES